MQKLLVVAVLLLCSLCLCHCSLFGGKARALSLKPALIAEAVVDKKEKDNNMQLNALELCLCGAMATIFGDFVMHPVDTIKIMQQSAATSIGFLTAAKAILQKSGPLGFYQGVVPYLIGDGLSGAVKFASFELSKNFLESKLPEQFYSLTQFLCAAGAMLTCSVILVPGEVLKTKLQTGLVSSLGNGIRDIIATDGIKGLFVGYYATLVRDIPYTMLELGLYENIKQLIRVFANKIDLNAQDEFVAAAVTGGIAATLTTPLDLIKTKLMMQSSSGGAYSGVLDAFSSIYKAGGVKALFVGAGARVAWLLPFTVIYLGFYERAKRSIITYKTKKSLL